MSGWHDNSFLILHGVKLFYTSCSQGLASLHATFLKSLRLQLLRSTKCHGKDYRDQASGSGFKSTFFCTCETNRAKKKRWTFRCLCQIRLASALTLSLTSYPSAQASFRCYARNGLEKSRLILATHTSAAQLIFLIKQGVSIVIRVGHSVANGFLHRWHLGNIGKLWQPLGLTAKQARASGAHLYRWGGIALPATHTNAVILCRQWVWAALDWYALHWPLPLHFKLSHILLESPWWHRGWWIFSNQERGLNNGSRRKPVKTGEGKFV